MIDRGDGTSGNRPLQRIFSSTAGRWLWSVRAQGWQPDCKIQRSGRGNGQRDWCMSRVTAIISALVICIIVCLSWAVNHYRDNAITYKAQRYKNARELEAGERGNYWHADASADVALDAKYTKELADSKVFEMMLCVMTATGRRRLHQSSLSVRVKPPPLRRDTAASPDWQTRWTGLFHPQREADYYKKTTGRNPEVY